VISISVEVARGAARYRVAVRTQSIGRALEIVGGQGSGCEVKVAFPIDPEPFSVRDAATMAGEKAA
jgi:acetaldehyde dehydrogenase (acetylating)